jgi:hypothetical protein
LKPNCGCFLCGETEEVGRGEYRSRHVAEPNQLVAGEQPSRPRFFESRPLRSGGGKSDGGGEALRFEELDRAELQAGKERFGRGTLPGKEEHLHSPPLADGVLRLHLLLVGGFGSPGGRDIAWGQAPSEGTRPGLRKPEGRRKGEKRSDPRSKPPELSWPLALRRVRAWLEPYVMLMRYSGGRSGICPRQRG